MYALLVIGIAMQVIVLERFWVLFGPASNHLRRQAAHFFRSMQVMPMTFGVRHFCTMPVAVYACCGLWSQRRWLVCWGRCQECSSLSPPGAGTGGAGGAGMALGIGQAMITTQMGLTLALPGLLAHRVLLRRAEALLATVARHAHVRRSTTKLQIQPVRATSAASSSM